jgi:hypothetical protein
MKKKEEEEEEEEAEIGKGRGRALPTYNTVEQKILFYYKHTFFFTPRKRLLMPW